MAPPEPLPSPLYHTPASRALQQALRAGRVRRLWRPVQAPAVQRPEGRLRGGWLALEVGSLHCCRLRPGPASVSLLLAPASTIQTTHGCRIPVHPMSFRLSLMARPHGPAPTIAQVAICTPGRMIDLIKMKACTMKRVTYLVRRASAIRRVGPVQRVASGGPSGCPPLLPALASPLHALPAERAASWRQSHRLHLRHLA